MEEEGGKIKPKEGGGAQNGKVFCIFILQEKLVVMAAQSVMKHILLFFEQTHCITHWALPFSLSLSNLEEQKTRAYL